MKKKLLVLAALFILVLGTVSMAGAASKHVLLISNPNMTMLWSDYLSNDPDIKVTVAQEPDLLDDLFGVFDEDAMASYDAIVMGELFMEAGNTGAVLMPEDIQTAIKERVADGAGFVL